MASIYPSSTSSSSTSSANLLRISGMASGIDTDAVVKSMVSNYQAKIDKANQDKQLLQWKQDTYRDIIKDIKGLQDYFDPISSKYILSENSFNVNAASSSDSIVASATAAINSKAGTYKVDVTQMASQAEVEGGSQDSLVSVTKIENWNGTLDFGIGSITLSGLTGTATPPDSTSMSNLVNSINKQIAASSSLNGKISASYVSDDSKSYIKFTKSTTSSDTIVLSKSSSTFTDKANIASDLTINKGVSSTTLLTDLGFKAKSDTESGIIGFKLTNGTTSSSVSLTVDSSSTIQDLKNAVNSATNGAVIMNVDDTTGKISFQSKSYGSSSSISIADTSTGSNDISKLGITTTTYTGVKNNAKSTSLLTDLGFSTGDISFTLKNGVTSSNVSLTVDSSTTISDLMTAINAATTGDVTMNIDDNTGKISFNSTDSINITDVNTTNNVLTTLGLSPSTAVSTGTDAIVEITEPGQSTATAMTQSSNKFTTNGVTYNLSNIGTTNVTVTANTDTVVSNMKKFIDDYNSVISKINTELTEKKNSDYPPLTDAQKESMSEDQITAWETKAKVGILRNDDYLNSLLNQLRGAFSSPVYSSYTDSSTNSRISLNFGSYGTGAIGIDTSSTSYTDGGKLYIKDEEKLKSAIENNIEDFKKMFIGESNKDVGSNQSYVGSSKYMEDGIFTRMDSILRDYVAGPGLGKEGTYSLSGSMNIFVNKQYDSSISGTSSRNTLPDQVYSKTLSISKIQRQMSDAETRYYARFTALETAMNNLNSQQSQLSSMLGLSY